MADARLLLDRLAATVQRLGGPTRTTSAKAVTRDEQGRIIGLMEVMAPVADTADLADGIATMEALTPLLPSMSDKQTYEFVVGVLGLTEGGERHAGPALKAELRGYGDQLRGMLQDAGWTISPWYR